MELSSKTGLSQASLRKHLTFWVNQGVIREMESGDFVTADSYTHKEKQSMYMCVYIRMCVPCLVSSPCVL